jgi:hypothetical protein
MKPSEVKKKLDAIRAQQDINRFQSELNRARSVTIGTAFGGTTELSLRADGGQTIWCLMQPVEVIELIHQLSANVGCHIQLKPRNDFSSWREWRVSEAEKQHLDGHAPQVNDMAVFQQLGASNFDQAKVEKIIEDNLAPKEYAYVDGGAVKTSKKQGGKNGNVVATKKTVNGRNVKRTPKAS